MRKPVSVTLDQDNIIWLKGRARASARGSLSEVLDRLVTRARLEGRTDDGAIRSVVGTIDFPDDDESLAEMDVFVRSCFDESLERTAAMLRESPPPYRTTRRQRKKKAR
ncbi:MAG TPA: hypothetical protein VMN81_04830 [Vicinamibacterales bacterium]|nr:hypothetical protein [Vicinamibacterales bacterium]